MELTILVIGSGGREHVVAQKLLESPHVKTIFCAKGNPGMEKEGIQLVDIEEGDHQGLIQFAKKHQVDWTFVGPEVPLFNGIVDDFIAAGLRIFGPDKKAAIIEGSKDFAKELMTNYQIPTANYQTFDNFKKAKAFVEQKEMPIVIKADGLAAGKGVSIATSQAEAVTALKEILKDNKFGASGNKVVIEEFLVGEEFSLLAFVQNETVYPMVIAQDHKRAYDNDLGPNTGGMGAYAPVPQISDDLVDEAIQTILLPTAKAMVQENRAFTGILYAGLIATDAGVKVIEFNARFGDPETQVVLQRLESDLAIIITDLLDGKKPDIHWKKKGYSLGVVVAAKGYPEAYETGIKLPKIVPMQKEHIYYAGIKEEGDSFISSGGRIYLVEASGDSLFLAQKNVYDKLKTLGTTDTFYRTDIGNRGVSLEQVQAAE